MDLPFGKKAGVADLRDMLKVSFPHIREDFGVFLGVGEVVDFIRVFLQVIEFLGRLGLPEVALSFVEFAFVEEAFPNLRRGGYEHISDMLTIEFVGHVVANVDIAFADHAAHHVVTLVHSSSETVSVFLGGSFVLAHEGVALHMGGWFLACNAQEGRGEVDKPNPAIAASAHLVV